MNLIESNFRKHGRASFGVWIPQGETVCTAFIDSDKVIAGFVKPSLWKAVHGEPDMSERLQESLDFWRIYDVRIVKSGWFMFATVDFTLALGAVMRGKTDKKFAEFLVGLFNSSEMKA